MFPRNSTHFCIALALAAFSAAACSGGSNSTADARANSGDSALVIDANGSPDANSNSADAGSFSIVSTAYSEGGVIPTKHSCAGVNISPALAWDNAPDNTQSFAVVFLDTTTNFLHSAIWDIPSSRADLPEDIEKAFAPGNVPSAKQPNSYLGIRGYAGPCPGTTHTYEFRLHALSATSLPGLSQSSSKEAVVAAIEATSMASVALTGSYTP